MSKSFFSVPNKVVSFKRSSFMAKRFATLRDGDILTEPPGITEYIHELYSCYGYHRLSKEIVPLSDSLVVYNRFEKIHLQRALNKLSSGKAIGLDGLADVHIKNPQISESAQEKLISVFNDWYSGTSLPEYCRTGRIFCLSKELTEYPSVGAIRTISILPAVTKLYELMLIQLLKADI